MYSLMRKVILRFQLRRRLRLRRSLSRAPRKRSRSQKADWVEKTICSTTQSEATARRKMDVEVAGPSSSYSIEEITKERMEKTTYPTTKSGGIIKRKTEVEVAGPSSSELIEKVAEESVVQEEATAVRSLYDQCLKALCKMKEEAVDLVFQRPRGGLTFSLHICGRSGADTDGVRLLLSVGAFTLLSKQHQSVIMKAICVPSTDGDVQQLSCDADDEEVEANAIRFQFVRLAQILSDMKQEALDLARGRKMDGLYNFEPGLDHPDTPIDMYPPGMVPSIITALLHYNKNNPGADFKLYKIVYYEHIDMEGIRGYVGFLQHINFEAQSTSNPMEIKLFFAEAKWNPGSLPYHITLCCMVDPSNGQTGSCKTCEYYNQGRPIIKHPKSGFFAGYAVPRVRLNLSYR